MRTEPKSTRLREGLKLTIPVHVRLYELGGTQWDEETQLTSVTPSGGGFTLSRPIEPGRLLHLSTPMPRNLRCYDVNEEMYKIWGLVRYIDAFPPDDTGQTRFSIGIAFLGRNPPATFSLDPSTLYDLRPTLDRSGLWVAREQPRKTSANKPIRQYTRFDLQTPVTLEAFNNSGKIEVREVARTENVSRRGSAVNSSLTAEPGSFIRLTSSEHHVSLLGIVRARRTAPDGTSTLHLEFVGREWPIDQSTTA
jgi:hypothetical protein